MDGDRRERSGVDRAGLSSVAAARLLLRDGPNAVPPGPRVRLWWRVAGQLRDPLSLVLLAAAALTTTTADWADTAVIALVVVVNTTVGVVQEVRADRAITALATVTAAHARVIRDGVERRIPAAEVVIGDLVVLAEGDLVPADAVVRAAAGLLVDEAALTGESVPVPKDAADRDRPADTVAAGSLVVHGHGRAVVTATGAGSGIGRVVALMGTAGGLTPSTATASG